MRLSEEPVVERQSLLVLLSATYTKLSVLIAKQFDTRFAIHLQNRRETADPEGFDPNDHDGQSDLEVRLSSSLLKSFVC